MPIMGKSDAWTIRCEDPNDGSDDLIINLPNELLNRMTWKVGDRLQIEVMNGSILLRPVAESSASQMSTAQDARIDASSFYRSCLQSLLRIPTDATDQQIHDLVESGFT